MPRSVRDAKLDTREARLRLRVQGKPHWRLLEPGLHMGYRRLRNRPGTWTVRRYVGAQIYTVESLDAVADDYSEADGEKVLNFQQAQRKALERKPKAAGPLTVRQVVGAYCDWVESNRRSGYDTRIRAEAFIYPKLGDTKIEALTTEVVERWHASLAAEPPRARTSRGEKQQHRSLKDDEAIRRRRSTANRVLTILRAALNRAWRAGKVSSDSAWRRVEPFENVDAARIRYLTVAEAQRLINTIAPEFRPLVLAALQTGARYGELIRLQVHDFNPDAGTLAIRQSKSGRSRHIVLTDEGVALFTQLTAGRSGHETMLRRDGGGPFGKSHQSRPMQEACARANISPPLGFHGLRHTWASLSVMNGVPLHVVAKNLGHSDTRMVERHYGHMSPSYIADAIRAGAPRFGFKTDWKVATLTGRA